MSDLILLRHGQSTWNEKNLFTGWVDVDLTPLGCQEASAAGSQFTEAGLLPTVVHTSLLRRAIKTANLALEECERSWIPVRRTWRLNERHYGGLQGLNKSETLEKYGADQLNAWRRSYDVPPPPIEPGSEYDNTGDPRYDDADVPSAECLKDVVERMLPYWFSDITVDLDAGHCVLVVAHGNSLRALIKYLEGVSDADIAEFNVPTGVPRHYRLNDEHKVESVTYLGDQQAIADKAAAVAAQASGK